MSDPIIHVDNLVKKFGQLAAVDHISFDVAPGEIFGFLGPNGAGKTTTINILCTLLKPTGGSTRSAEMTSSSSGTRSDDASGWCSRNRPWTSI